MIGGREVLVVSRLFWYFRLYGTGLPVVEGGDEGGVDVLDLKVSGDSWGEVSVAGGLDD